MNPKFFISILSCARDESNGNNQAFRDTCLKDATELGIEHKFFIGHGGVPKDDVVLVDSGDDYWSIIYKVVHRYRLTLETPYDYFFFCDVDTYFCAERLLMSGFEKYDYFGDFYHTDPRQPWPHESYGRFCQGGPGFMIHRKVLKEASKDLKIYTESPERQGWGWEFPMGDTIKSHPEFKVGDCRFFTTMLSLEDEGPRKTNSVITAHMSTIGDYKKEYMYKKYQEWQDSFQGKFVPSGFVPTRPEVQLSNLNSPKRIQRVN